MFTRSSFNVFHEPSDKYIANGSYGHTNQAIGQQSAKAPFQVVNSLDLTCSIKTTRVMHVKISVRCQSL
jgi:hypothetical protein